MDLATFMLLGEGILYEVVSPTYSLGLHEFLSIA